MTMDVDHSDGPDGDRILVGEFVLGLLGADEHQLVARRIAGEPALASEMALWQSRLSSLDGQFAEAAPPARVWPALERRLFTGTPASPASGFWNSLALWRGLAAAGLAIAVIAVGYNALVPRAPLTGKELIAALEQDGSGVKFVAFYDENSGTVRLAALSGEAVPQKDYELWAIKGSNAPQSMGVIPVDAKSDIALSAKIKEGFGEGTILAITLEPKGGSPTGAPTGPIVAKGSAIAI